MFLDLIFQIWRRFSGPLQWFSLWLISSKFMISVSGIVLDTNGKVLLQRHRHWVADVWGLPGGIVQAGESLENAFAREVFEETGLRISDIKLMRINSGYRLRLVVFFQARLMEGDQTIKLQKQEVTEADFFSLECLPPNMLPFQRQLIEAIRQGELAANSRDAVV
jgi:8-oxo-dGTP diphosphatase